MMFAPLEGWRHVKCTDRHTALYYAQVLKELSDIHFPNAMKIVLVQDNLNTHKPASLYEAFPAAEARRLVERFEWHYTPNASRASARQLAQYGRIRTRRARVAVSGSPHRRQANPRPRSQRMAGPPQQAPRQGQLAIQNRRRPRQAEETLPSVRVTRATSRDPLSRGFSHFVTSMAAPVASGWSICRVGLAPTGKRRLFTAHTYSGHRPTKERRAWFRTGSSFIKM